MKRIILVALVLVAIFGTNVSAFFLQLQTPTTYTDNTAIEPEFTVYFDVWVDGSPLALMYPTVIPFTRVPLIDNTFGATHTYRARTHLSDGRLSADYTVTLTSPLDNRLPKHPAATLPAQIVK